MLVRAYIVKPEPQSFRAVQPAMHGDNDSLAIAIHDLANAVRGAAHNHSRPVTKSDLNKLEENITMRLDQIKSTITAASKQTKEALAEIGTRIADLNAKIDELTQAATDPDVTDEQFLTDLNSLREDAQALADIVPGSPSGEPPTNGTGVVDPTPDRRV